MGPEYTRFRDSAMIRPGEQTLVQVDIDPRHAGWVYPVDLAITGDAAEVLALLDTLPINAATRGERLSALAEIKQQNGYGILPQIPTRPGTLHYADIMRGLDAFLTPNDLLTLDAGTNRIWATTSLCLRTPHQLIAPGGIGGMGWSTPAATAVKMVRPERRVTGVIGDGGFVMTMDAIATAAERNLDVVYVVANNAGLGMVRDNLGNRKIGVDFGEHDFTKVAEGLGGSGLTVTDADQMTDALEEAHKMGGPVVLDVKVDPAASHRDCSDYDPLPA
jgi:acetolactate synthase-1/2/3 large subunit